MRSPFGIALHDSIMPESLTRQPVLPPMQTPAPAAQPQRMGRGQLILGVLADALAGAQGRPGMFAQQIGQRRQDEREQAQEQARWHRDRQGNIEDFRTRQQIEAQYPAPSPMVRDLAAWQAMTAEQRAALGEMQTAQRGDPDVFVTLPNGQVYAGPRSGLAAAMTSGGQAPAAPVGRLTPITPAQGGPTPPASGNFRP